MSGNLNCKLNFLKKQVQIQKLVNQFHETTDSYKGRLPVKWFKRKTLLKNSLNY